MSDAPLSAYELERAENIKRNHATLVALGLADGGIVPKREPTPKVRRPKREPSTHRAVPARQSSRIAGVKASDVYVASETAGGRVVLGGAEQSQASPADQADKKRADALTLFQEGDMPLSEEELLEGEQGAFEALRAVKREKAQELQIEGYKIAQHRSLCEMVRLLPESLEELRECWGFGGSGIRLEKYGELFLSTLRPFLPALRGLHEASKSLDGLGEAKNETADHRTGFDLSVMPKAPEDLLQAERVAYDAVIARTHERASDIGEQYLWNIAASRTVCEMTRRLPETVVELRGCWGMGGQGKKASKHGDFLVAALRPHLAALRSVHEALAHGGPEEVGGTAAAASGAAADEAGPAADLRSSAGGEAEDEEDEPLSKRRRRTRHSGGASKP